MGQVIIHFDVFVFDSCGARAEVDQKNWVTIIQLQWHKICESKKKKIITEILVKYFDNIEEMEYKYHIEDTENIEDIQFIKDMNEM